MGRQVWRRIAGLFGTAQDRAVETGHRLLAAGFPVRIYDQQLRQRILTAISSQNQHVIRKLSTANMLGWFGISWPRSEDTTGPCRLPGAKWDKPYVVVPPEQFEAVVGFAETYDFALSWRQGAGRGGQGGEGSGAGSPADRAEEAAKGASRAACQNH